MSSSQTVVVALIGCPSVPHLAVSVHVPSYDDSERGYGGSPAGLLRVAVRAQTGHGGEARRGEAGCGGVRRGAARRKGWRHKVRVEGIQRLRGELTTVAGPTPPYAVCRSGTP